MRNPRIACNTDHVLPLGEHNLEFKNGELKIFVTIRNSYSQQDLSNHITFRPIKSGVTIPDRL
jgi:hypothetical protein